MNAHTEGPWSVIRVEIPGRKGPRVRFHVMHVNGSYVLEGYSNEAAEYDTRKEAQEVADQINRKATKATGSAQ